MFLRSVLYGLLFAVIPLGAFGQTMDRFTTQDDSLKVLQRDLSLSDLQVSNVKELLEARHVRLQAIRQQAKPAFEELLKRMRQPDPDPQAVGKAAIVFRQIHERAIAEQANSEKEFLSLLNPEQQQIVNDLPGKAPLIMALHQLRLLTPERSNDQARTP